MYYIVKVDEMKKFFPIEALFHYAGVKREEGVKKALGVVEARGEEVKAVSTMALTFLLGQGA